jgi:hypothetical protein
MKAGRSLLLGMLLAVGGLLMGAAPTRKAISPLPTG